MVFQNQCRRKLEILLLVHKYVSNEFDKSSTQFHHGFLFMLLSGLASQYILIQEETEILPEIPIPRKLIFSKQRVWWLAIGSTGIVGLGSNSWVKNIQVSTRHACDTHVRDIFSYTFPRDIARSNPSQ